MATVEDLYYQLLGRAPDAEGLFHWKNAFGESVDPAEAADFLKVAQAELANSGYVAAPQAVANIVAPTTNDSPVASTPAAPTRPSTVNDLYQTFYGTEGDPGGLSYWGGAEKAITPKDAASWLLWAGKDPSIANKSTGLTVDKAYETYLGFKPDETARNYWTGGDPNKALTTAELAAITSEAYGLNPQKDGGILGTGFGPDISLEQAAMLAGAYFGAPALSGAIGGATGLTGAALSGATGAAIGGTGAALTGGDVLKGALTGGALGYGGGLLQEGLSGTAGAGANAPDNIDIGGGWNPASGSLTNLDALRADNIDVGGGWNPATGTGDAATAAAAAETGVTSSASTPRYGLPTTSGGLTNVGAGTGLTASKVIKAIPLVTTVNSLVGDPLGLQPKQPDTTTTPTGFGIVPIPEGWRSPTYSQGAQTPIDLSKIFTDQNLLTGTQWEGLPNQRNLTFNDIFAAGQQSTPMGTPVNINNLVSAILGQTATSQKSA